MTVHDGAEHATRSADGAVAHHNWLPVYGVAHLVVIAYELNWKCAGLAIDVDTDDEPGRVHLVSIGRHHSHRFWRNEHFIGDHLEVHRVGDHRRKNKQYRHGESFSTGSAPCGDCSGDDQRHKNRAEQPTPRVQRVRQIDAGHALTAGHRHDEVHVRDLEQHQQTDTDVEEFFHGPQLLN